MRAMSGPRDAISNRANVRPRSPGAPAPTLPRIFAATTVAQAHKEMNGKHYVKMNGQWFEAS